MLRRYHLLFLLIFLSLISAGCRELQLKDRVTAAVSKKYEVDNFYVDPDLGEGRVRRVLFVPPRNLSDHTGTEDFLQDASSIMLMQIRKAKIFDIVPYETVLSPDERAVIDALDIEGKGSYDADSLLKIAQNVNVQGILLCSITQYNPNQPLVFGMKLSLIQIRSGRIVWAVDEVFDAARDDVKNLARFHYYNSYDTSNNPSLRWELLLSSMNEFMKFTIAEIVKTYSLTSE
ncbi:MAG: hypothetical protein JW928_05450 [Candidatus Aureabacteria bacterium]|nr:hypothetical protein [Candidatus Auribacterota bacterium]